MHTKPKKIACGVLIARSAHVVGVPQIKSCPFVLRCPMSVTEVIENTRAAYRGWTHAFPYADFDHLIFQDFKKSKKGPSCFSFKT